MADRDWQELWNDLKAKGWTEEEGGNPERKDRYYIRPNCTRWYPYKREVDYFVSRKQVRLFLQQQSASKSQTGHPEAGGTNSEHASGDGVFASSAQEGERTVTSQVDADAVNDKTSARFKSQLLNK